LPYFVRTHCSIPAIDGIFDIPVFQHFLQGVGPTLRPGSSPGWKRGRRPIPERSGAKFGKGKPAGNKIIEVGRKMYYVEEAKNQVL
jgi:hypothetical protein